MWLLQSHKIKENEKAFQTDNIEDSGTDTKESQLEWETNSLKEKTKKKPLFFLKLCDIHWIFFLFFSFCFGHMLLIGFSTHLKN